MTFSRILQAGFIAATTMVACAGGSVDQPSSAKGNILTDIMPAMLKHNTYIGIEGGVSYFNDHSVARVYSGIDSHISSSSTEGGTYGVFFGIGNDFMKFEIGVKQYDNLSEYNVEFQDVTATMNGCNLVINDNRSITISNPTDCAAVTAVVESGLTIDSVDGSLTTSATYPFLAAKIGTKIRGIDAYVRPGVVFAGNHNLETDTTATFTQDGTTQTAKLGRSKSYDANPTFIGIGIQYPLHEAFAIGAEYQVVNNTSSINLNLAYKLG